MRTNPTVAVLAAFLMFPACGDGKSTSAAAGSGSGTPAARSASLPQSGSQTPSSTPSTAAGTATLSTPAPPIRVGVGRTDQLGPFLADASGRALYLLEEDGRGQSTCYEMCAAIWPPFLAGQGAPTSADPSVRSDLLGSVARQGGGSQVTYNGHPLYYYLGDAKPGQIRGHHVEDSWGEWYLVSPTGEHVREGGERGGRGGRGTRRAGDDDR